MPATPPAQRPTPLLTKGNRRLGALQIYSWSIPALSVELDGRTIRTCPSAGVCANVCYALAGTYRFSNVRRRHEANLRFVVEDLDGWETAMTAELSHPRFRGRRVRIHDAGDFYSTRYTKAWLRIIRATPKTRFYAYTKEIPRFRRLVEPDPPANFRWCYSYGGLHDEQLDPRRDRVADVFPDEKAIAAAGWHSQAESDLLAVDGPSPVGIPANRIRHFLIRLGDRTFSQWQAEENAKRRRPRREPLTRRHTGKAALMQPASPHDETGIVADEPTDPENQGHQVKEGREDR